MVLRMSVGPEAMALGAFVVQLRVQGLYDLIDLLQGLVSFVSRFGVLNEVVHPLVVLLKNQLLDGSGWAHEGSFLLGALGNSKADSFKVTLRLKHVHDVIALIVELRLCLVPVGLNLGQVLLAVLVNLGEEKCRQENEGGFLHNPNNKVETHHDVPVEQSVLGPSRHLLIKMRNADLSLNGLIRLNNQLEELAVESLVLSLWIVDSVVHHGKLLGVSQ